MTNSNDRLDRIEELIQETNQIIRSNAKAIEALSAETAANRADIAATRAETAANRADIAATRASVDGLVQTIAEFSIRSEARLNRLDDAVVGIERILEQLVRRDGSDHQPPP